LGLPLICRWYRAKAVTMRADKQVMNTSLPRLNIQASAGFTLVEMAVSLAVVAIVCGVGVLAFSNQGEAQDAVLANSVQGSLQTALGQLTLRLERPPAQVFGNANFRQRIIQFAQGSMGPQAVLTNTGNGIQLSFGNSRRTVTYGMNAMGDVVMTAETFQKFNIDATGKLEGG
jgi:prepilin-type N-terminal cleavage/methylation domain-containing protein